jgi:hypothetical protein
MSERQLITDLASNYAQRLATLTLDTFDTGRRADLNRADQVIVVFGALSHELVRLAHVVEMSEHELQNIMREYYRTLQPKRSGVSDG